MENVKRIRKPITISLTPVAYNLLRKESDKELRTPSNMVEYLIIKNFKNEKIKK